MNIAVFMDEVMAINGPLMLIPKNQSTGPWRPNRCHDDALSTVDARQGNRHQPGAGGRHRCADREARLGADVPRQSGARLGAEHHALPRRIVYLTLCAVSNYIRTLTRPEWIAHRDFMPIQPVADEALLNFARNYYKRAAAE